MLYLVVGVAAVTWLLLWSTTSPPRLLGVYSRPGFWYWLKVAIFYIIVKVRRLSYKTVESGSEAGYGVKSHSNPEQMECVQPLSDHPKAIDAVYFNGANESGHYLVIATARRPNGVINGFFYLRVPGVGLLQLPKMPDTMLFGEGKGFAAEGLCITPVKPMAVWKIQYEGPMKMKDKPLSSLKVKLDVQFTSQQPYFDFDTDMSASALARSMAMEPWSRKYFQDLRDAHQTHYEQMGRLEGTVVVDDHPYILRLDSLRDHSYGHKRDWKLMHRYGLHMFNTADGLQGNVGIVCQPATCTHLEMGYICEGGKLTAVSSVNLPLWQHGENGHPPSDYAFSFVAGGKDYVVEVFVLETPEFYIGWEWETRVVERMATFRINGRKGWGVAEWDYRHQGGRPRAYSFSDPAWTADLVKEAEEEKIMVKSDDDPVCVVHYHGLVDDRSSRIILLSERSYGKLIECKNIRTELGGESYHDQCETIPAPGFDHKKDGYHRPCYMKFIKIKMDEKKTKHDQSQNDIKNTENHPENHLENKMKTENENYTESKTKDENLENKRNIEHDNYSESESKAKNENCTENENKPKDEQYSEDECHMKGNYYSDDQRKTNNGSYSNDQSKAKDEDHTNIDDVKAENYSENENNKTEAEIYSLDENEYGETYSENKNDGNYSQNKNDETYSENKNDGNYSENKNDGNYSENKNDETYSENDNDESKSKNDSENDSDETEVDNHSENEENNDDKTKTENYYENEGENENPSESVSDTTFETENKDENQNKAHDRYNSENQSKTRTGNYSVEKNNCHNCNGFKKRHSRTYMSEDNQ